jgi:integrase
VEEIIAVMRQADDDRHGFRLRALIVVLWRGGLRIQEALALGERDLDPRDLQDPPTGSSSTPSR